MTINFWITHVKDQSYIKYCIDDICINTDVSDFCLLSTRVFVLGCVRPLGMEDRRIPNDRITASTTLQGTQPYMARLNNIPATAGQPAHWSPAFIGFTFIQVSSFLEAKISYVWLFIKSVTNISWLRIGRMPVRSTRNCSLLVNW